MKNEKQKLDTTKQNDRNRNDPNDAKQNFETAQNKGGTLQTYIFAGFENKLVCFDMFLFDIFWALCLLRISPPFGHLEL